jgi:hypothetical protein
MPGADQSRSKMDKDKNIDVVVGVLIYRQGAYVIDKFLANQKEIQREYPGSELVFAVNEADFVEELKQLINVSGVRADVILYEAVKPHYAKSRVWNVTCGREALRKYILSQTQAEYFLSLDADMIYEPGIVKIMEKEIRGYDIVFSGCPLRDYGIGLAGAGCVMISRSTLEKIRFRCIEFKNGDVMFEDNLLEFDSFRLRNRIKRGFFLHVSHYKSANEVRNIEPHRVSLYQTITTSMLVRYLLIRASLIAKRNIPWRLKVIADKLRGDVW